MAKTIIKPKKVEKNIKPIVKSIPKPLVKPIQKPIPKKIIKTPVKKPVIKPTGNSIVKKPIIKKPIVKSTTKADLIPAKLSVKKDPNLIQTKIPQLDNLLNGGIKKGSLTCLWIKPGLDGTAFAYQIANSASQTNKVFYIVNSKAPDTASAELSSFGFKGKINFIDSYSALVNKESKSNLSIGNPKDINEVIKDISVIVKKITNPVIILDSLSTLIDLTGENTDFLAQLKQLKSTTLCLFTEWPYKPNFISSIKNVFDNIIEIKSVEEKLFFRQYFGVSKISSKEISGQAIPYKITKPGGIKIYIPKVLVTGPFGAGKTSFIHTSSEKAVSVDRLGTTIALDHGHVKYKDFAVDLFGTPGQQRFDPILKLLGGESLGVIVVISAIDPEGFPRAIEMMKKAKVYGLPVVFAANKANLRGALKPEQIKKRLGIEEDVIPITAKDLTKVQPGLPCQLKEEDIEKILDVLFSRLLRGKLK